MNGAHDLLFRRIVAGERADTLRRSWGRKTAAQHGRVDRTTQPSEWAAFRHERAVARPCSGDRPVVLDPR